MITTLSGSRRHAKVRKMPRRREIKACGSAQSEKETCYDSCLVMRLKKERRVSVDQGKKKKKTDKTD